MYVWWRTYLTWSSYSIQIFHHFMSVSNMECNNIILPHVYTVCICITKLKLETEIQWTETTQIHKPKSENFVFKCHRYSICKFLLSVVMLLWLLLRVIWFLRMWMYVCMHACRDQDARDIFSVNAISFHPRNTFCSAGSDGVLTIWDKEAR